MTTRAYRAHFTDLNLNPPLVERESVFAGKQFSSRAEARAEMRKEGLTACEVCQWSLPQVLCREHSSNLLQVHHIVPRKVGGPHCAGNLVLLCRNCHATAHRLFRVHTGNAYCGPVGRTAFLREMRLFLWDPDHWWRRRRAEVRRTTVGPWETREVTK